MILQAGRPVSSSQVRIWRASGWKQAAWRDQSRGPFGPEIIAYISSTAAPISALSCSSLVINLLFNCGMRPTAAPVDKRARRRLPEAEKGGGLDRVRQL